MTPVIEAPSASMRGAKPFLSRREVALLFAVSPHTVYRWTRQGRLPYVLTPGGRHRYPREEIVRLADTWLRVHRVQAARLPGEGQAQDERGKV